MEEKLIQALVNMIEVSLAEDQPVCIKALESNDTALTNAQSYLVGKEYRWMNGQWIK